MSAMTSQITSLTVVCSAVYPGGDQRKHQSFTRMAFVRGIHQWPMNSPHRGPIMRRMVPFDDVIMCVCKTGPKQHNTHEPDDVMTLKLYLYYWPLVCGFHRSPLDSPQKARIMPRFDVFLIVCDKFLHCQRLKMTLLWRHCDATRRLILCHYGTRIVFH